MLLEGRGQSRVRVLTIIIFKKPFCSVLMEGNSNVQLLYEQQQCCGSHRNIQEADLSVIQTQEPSFANVLQRRNGGDRSYKFLKNEPLIPFPNYSIYICPNILNHTVKEKCFLYGQITLQVDVINGFLFHQPEVYPLELGLHQMLHSNYICKAFNFKSWKDQVLFIFVVANVYHHKQ